MKIFYLIALLFILLSCNTTDKPQQQWVILNDKNNTFSIQNTNNFAIQFQLKLNNLFPLDSIDIMNQVKELQQNKSYSMELAAWSFVTNSTFHSNPLTKEAWQHNPLLFLNSIGGGFCDDRASLLAQIWNDLGYPSRLIGLEGHVVPEVFINQKWQMMDPDLKIMYFNSDSVIYSVKEIEKLGENVIPNKKNDLFNPIFNYKNPLSKQFMNFYTSTKDNINQTQWHLDYPKTNNDFILPPHSQLDITLDEITKRATIQVHLTSKSIGKLKIPLVPYCANGCFNFIANNTIHSASDTVYFPVNQLINEMEISNVKNTATIQYLVNPKLEIAKKENKLSLSSNQKLKIVQKKCAINKDPLFEARNLFLDSKAPQHRAFVEYMVQFENPQIDNFFLIQLYQKLLDYDKLSDIEIRKSTSEFEKTLDKITTYPPNFKLFEENYPMHILLFFMIIKYDRLDLLQEDLIY